MNKSQLFNILNISDIMDMPDSISKLLFGDIDKRNAFYTALLNINRDNIGIDWFQGIYQAELAQRGQNKQDFTPSSLSVLASLLTGNTGNMHEPTAGTGSMLIADWYNRCRIHIFPWHFRPSQHLFTCWELSDRAIPILLLNLSIRGMMGYVYHGDVLTMSIKNKYTIINRDDDPFAFSDIIKIETK